MFINAKPVWLPESHEVNRYVAFQNKFYCTEKSNLTLAIRANSQYVIWINGKLAGFGQYPDYEEYGVCDVYEIKADFLEETVNLISCLGYCQHENSSTYRKGEPGIIYELTDCKGTSVVWSGKETICSLHSGYLSGEIEKTTVQLGYSFFYDMTGDQSWISKSMEGNNGWRSANIVKPATQYIKRPIKKLALSYNDVLPVKILTGGVFQDGGGENPATRMSKAFMRPENIYTHEYPTYLAGNSLLLQTKGDAPHDGMYIVLDLERQIVGYFTIEIDVQEECILDVGYGEHLEDLRVRSFVGGRHFAFGIKLKKGKNEFTHYFRRIAGRYIQLHLFCAKAEIVKAGIIPANYPVEVKALPKGLDRLEKRIYEVSADTLRLCMHEHYEDTPWREQALYAMDGRNQMLCGYYAFGEYEFAKESLRLLAYGLREDGLLELCAPARVPLTIPSFSLMWVYALEEYVRYSGDAAFCAEMMKYVDIIMKTFIDRMEDGLTTAFQGDAYWNFYEWNKGLDGAWNASIAGSNSNGYELADSAINAFFAMALKAASMLKQRNGQDDTLYNETYTRLKEDYNRAFWNEKNQFYQLYSLNNGEEILSFELIQALALRGELCDSSQSLLEKLASKAFDIPCTLSHMIFKFEALLENESYHDVIREEIANIWGNMLFKGATSLWETTKGADDFNNAGSLCHAWSAIPVYFYHRMERQI